LTEYPKYKTSLKNVTSVLSSSTARLSCYRRMRRYIITAI
jgi:hypothetical protein